MHSILVTAMSTDSVTTVNSHTNPDVEFVQHRLER
jgi:hypothetical protein